LVRFVLLAVLLLVAAWAFWRLMDGVIAALGGTTRQRQERARRDRVPAVKLARDPICGTWVQPGEALAVSARGTTHYFCSAKCRDQFERR